MIFKKQLSKVTLMAIGFGLLALSRPVLAAEHTNACKDDIQKFCSDATTRKDRMDCLKKNHDNVSDGCKEHMDKMKDKKAKKSDSSTGSSTPAAPASGGAASDSGSAQ